MAARRWPTRFANLIHDIALLHRLGIRLVLVHGARPQIEERLRRQRRPHAVLGGLRVTDDAALACVKEAAGAVRVEVEALLSMGLANSPMAGARIRVASGNFVTARPSACATGWTTAHRRSAPYRRARRRQRLDAGAIALIPPIGYSPTGEVFNLSAEDVARSAAIALGARQVVFLVEGRASTDDQASPSPT